MLAWLLDGGSGDTTPWAYDKSLASKICLKGFGSIDDGKIEEKKLPSYHANGWAQICKNLVLSFLSRYGYFTLNI
jgi:hypothetical protein